MVNIGVCKGYNCKKKNSGDVKSRLERVCKGLDYVIIERACSGHCNKGPMVCIGDDSYSGSSGVFLESDRKLRNFLANYESSVNIEGYCRKAKGRDCGLAVDIGTTVIKASLNDLVNGEVLGEVSTINKQVAYGSTVLHRWNYVNKSKDREDKISNLSRIVQESVKGIENYFVSKSKANIREVVLAGNTAMTYFFLAEDPALTLKSKPNYRFVKKKDGKVLLPCIFEWVGGDIVSGMLYLGFDKFDRNVMLIDLGTNGEVALSTKDRAILVASASAGPAFEGEGFRCGMPALKGAIYEVSSKKGKFRYKVLGRRKPLGLCGSGMLDLIAEMLANKVMGFNGKLDGKFGQEFFLTKGISVAQEEIDYFKESKAAIFATVQTLLHEAGLSYKDLDKIYIAGGFGNLNLEKAQLIGLLPPFDNYEFMGNTSLKGVQLCLKKKNLRRAEFLARSSTPLILTDSDVWMRNYLAALFFPHTNTELFRDILKKYMK